MRDTRWVLQEHQTADALELTRRAYAALNTADFDAVMELFGPTSVWDLSRWGLGTHAGSEAVRHFLDDWFAGLERYEVPIETMHDLGNGVVFVVSLHVGRGARAGGFFRMRSAFVFEWAEGAIARVTAYPDLEEGRAVAAQAAEHTPQRNLDLHRQIVEAIHARDVPDDLLAPGFRMENRATAATDYIYYGARGVREWACDLFEVFAEGARYGVEEIIGARDDFVVATFCLAGCGALSKEPLEFRWAGVTWFRDGKATRAVGYSSRREALEAVGLER